MKVLSIILIIIILLQADEKKDITLQLNWLNQFQFAGYYVAKEKGFYKDVGLNVTINELKDKQELTNIIKDGKVDFAIGRSSLLINKINGDDIVILGAIFQHSPLMLLTTNEEIKTIKDIKNKTIMITPDAEFTASITAMLNSNDINRKDLKIFKHSFNVDDLINKKVDLMSCYISNEPIILQEKGIKYKIFHPKDYGFDFYSDILFTSSKFIKENPLTTKSFYEATLKGWEYAFKNKTEAAEIIYKKYNTQNKSLINLIKEAEILESLVIDKDNRQIGFLDKNKLEKIFEVFKVLGLTNGKINLDNFIYTNNHHKKIIFEIAYEQKNMFIMLVIFISIIFVLTIFFLSRIHTKKKLLDAVINTSDDLIYYKDQRLKYIGCNDAFKRFANKSENEILGKDDFDIFENKFAKIFRDNDLKVLRTNKMSIDEEWLEFDNKLLLFQSKKRPLKYTETKIGILGVSRDITSLYEIQKKLEEQATVDELTKVYNRKSFNERLKEKIEMFRRYESNFCLALVDIDDFKKVNDTFGHDIGDEVLIKVCGIAKENIRNTDLIFRIGGEEFVILYPKTLIDEAFLSIEKITHIIKNENIIKNHQITLSVGLTQMKENDDEASIFKRIDDLMYISKKTGKDKITVD
ncbi:GGDEF domain-containing protein [Arcobacter defluvii]|uniref:Thiamine pyrimidine synthase n=1 Tax=Arcobacter defluvii TaxID=873191 RepID=A0AAE7E6I9_9BACT|nr:GGDEF domain-containing protein [Arcobacter defluvii]QKF77437.1 PAS sensor-containing diguanylate cyclase (NMT1 domain) [Arcobacter defluvii]RXI32104.1 diguanylate cyclase [Arcobacter defluvii]